MIVSIVGTGNVGSHLSDIFHRSEIEIGQILTRQNKGGDYISAQQNSNIILLAVSDDSIPEVVQKLDNSQHDCIIAHTAGSVPSTALNTFEAFGVFYPLQTFTRGRAVDWKEVPVLVTGSDSNTEHTLTQLAERITSRTLVVDDTTRLKLHLAATIANNFGNHMFALAESLLTQDRIDFDLLKPLISETADKLYDIPPRKAQTGAAKRNDKRTMAKHLELLSADPKLADLYRMISESITRLENSSE